MDKHMFEDLAATRSSESEDPAETYKACPHCGSQHLTAKPVPDCPQRGWTWKQVVYRTRFPGH
jgi:DNA-directed RNA polymerase subunit RPC12/RpoP